MKIGIDMDEVLAGFLPAFIAFHNNAYGMHLKINDFHAYHTGFEKIIGGTNAEAIQKLYEFHKTAYFKNMLPIAGAQDAVEKLKKNHELFIITSRQNDIIQETNTWVEKYFPNIFSGVYFTNQFSQNTELQKTKAEICDELGIEILIEDSVLNAASCARPDRKIYLFDYPWNHNDPLPAGTTRVHSWKELMEKIQ